jgi:phosphatidylserine/phosphatidylglycerophosphate/cardiolipin synthase-like enzyme
MRANEKMATVMDEPCRRIGVAWMAAPFAAFMILSGTATMVHAVPRRHSDLDKSLWFSCSSSDGGCSHVVTRAIRMARRTILIDSSALGPRPVLHALCSAARRGVRVDVEAARQPVCLMPGTATGGKSRATVCDPNFKVDSPQTMVIDGKVVITSFFASTASAGVQHPINHLLLIRSRVSALAYADSWERPRRPLQPEICDRTEPTVAGPERRN